jgi:hypothetical protein
MTPSQKESSFQKIFALLMILDTQNRVKENWVLHDRTVHKRFQAQQIAALSFRK